MKRKGFENHPDLKIFGKVYLHGSRFMNSRYLPWEECVDLPEDTDWDYAAQNVSDWQALVDEALKQGWIEVVDQSYTDANTAHVFEKMIDGQKVQVSLRQNLEAYVKAINTIEPDFYFKYLWKGSDICISVEDRRMFWDAMYYMAVR